MNKKIVLMLALSVLLPVVSFAAEPVNPPLKQPRMPLPVKIENRINKLDSKESAVQQKVIDMKAKLDTKKVEFDKKIEDKKGKLDARASSTAKKLDEKIGEMKARLDERASSADKKIEQRKTDLRAVKDKIIKLDEAKKNIIQKQYDITVKNFIKAIDNEDKLAKRTADREKILSDGGTITADQKTAIDGKLSEEALLSAKVRAAIESDLKVKMAAALTVDKKAAAATDVRASADAIKADIKAAHAAVVDAITLIKASQPLPAPATPVVPTPAQ